MAFRAEPAAEPLTAERSRERHRQGCPLSPRGRGRGRGGPSLSTAGPLRASPPSGRPRTGVGVTGGHCRDEAPGEGARVATTSTHCQVNPPRHQLRRARSPRDSEPLASLPQGQDTPIAGGGAHGLSWLLLSPLAPPRTPTGAPPARPSTVHFRQGSGRSGSALASVKCCPPRRPPELMPRTKGVTGRGRIFQTSSQPPKGLQRGGYIRYLFLKCGKEFFFANIKTWPVGQITGCTPCRGQNRS